MAPVHRSQKTKATKTESKRKSAPQLKPASAKSVRISKSQEELDEKSSPAHRVSSPVKTALKTPPTVQSLDELQPLLTDSESDSVDGEEGFGGIASDEDADAELPDFTQDGATQDMLSKVSKKERTKPGVIFIGRLPKGFEEGELKSYFEQFGTVNRLRLSRNKKSGASKHYAFVEFAHAAVADIVAETMDNHLLTGHILVCKVIPPAQVHARLWIGANKKFRAMPKNKLAREAHNAPKTIDQQKKLARKRARSDDQKRKKLQALNIDYSFAGYPKVDQASSHAKVESTATEEAEQEEDLVVQIESLEAEDIKSTKKRAQTGSESQAGTQRKSKRRKS